MTEIKFVHAADLHLGSPCKGIARNAERFSHVADTLRDAPCRALQNLVQHCLNEGVHFLLLSGDVFDGTDNTVRTLMRFRDEILKLADAGITVYMVCGNHDPLENKQQIIEWPDNLILYNADTPHTEFVTAGEETLASVTGISHGRKKESENLAKQFPPPSSNVPYKIALLHSNVGTDTGHEPYAPCTLSDLINADYDYWALGHVHSPQVLEKKPQVVYPGCTQGLSVNEQGARGCYEVRVDTDNKNSQVTWLSMDAVRWEHVDVDVSEADTIDRIEHLITQHIENIQTYTEGKPVVCRLNLVGQTALSGYLTESGNAEELCERFRERFAEQTPFVWVEQVNFKCTPAISIEERRQQSDLLARVLQIASQYEASSENLEELHSKGLEKLFQHRRAAKWLEPLTEEELQKVLREAQMLCLHLLEETENDEK